VSNHQSVKGPIKELQFGRSVTLDAVHVVRHWVGWAHDESSLHAIYSSSGSLHIVPSCASGFRGPSMPM